MDDVVLWMMYQLSMMYQLCINGDVSMMYGRMDVSMMYQCINDVSMMYQ